MHQKHLSNQDGKPEISVTPSNDTVDIQPVTPPKTETAENATLKPNKTRGSNANTHAAATAQSQPQPRYSSRLRKTPQCLGFDTYY